MTNFQEEQYEIVYEAFFVFHQYFDYANYPFYDALTDFQASY